MSISKFKELSNWTPQQIADMALSTFQEGRRAGNKDLIFESLELADFIGKGAKCD